MYYNLDSFLVIWKQFADQNLIHLVFYNPTFPHTHTKYVHACNHIILKKVQKFKTFLLNGFMVFSAFFNNLSTYVNCSNYKLHPSQFLLCLAACYTYVSAPPNGFHLLETSSIRLDSEYFWCTVRRKISRALHVFIIYKNVYWQCEGWGESDFLGRTEVEINNVFTLLIVFEFVLINNIK